ncbi:hypothetical protein [Methylophilus methylotrophus]|uniref:NERD domain-containing protein n=1 Tax=Methylophilus methylotrophus TaxID=17 RepID=B2MU10_METME|nr:hypothetical protein [Methylophilus methylotrophus]ACC85608.1 hypothetical protein [Methylophilus methylotrophus]
MYLTLNHPDLFRIVQMLPCGLIAFNHIKKPTLVIKTSKEAILTAKINREFKIYLYQTTSACVLVSAFFDDSDSPLFITTPIVRDDQHSLDLLRFLINNDFTICFFDELNREFLSVNATGNLVSIFESIHLMPLPSPEEAHNALNEAEFWFSLRSAADDESSIQVSLLDNLFPDDFVIYDLSSNKNDMTSLVRETKPGYYQEADIAKLLTRAFSLESIYQNPVKTSDSKELADVVVFGQKEILIIQAKDSENNQKQVLEVSLDKKCAKSSKKLSEALAQLTDTILTISNTPIVDVRVGKKKCTLNFEGKQLIGIVVVKELFNDIYDKYSQKVFEHVELSKAPIVFFDYPEFARMTFHCNSEELLLYALHRIFSSAIENGMYKRLRFTQPIITDGHDSYFRIQNRPHSDEAYLICTEDEMKLSNKFKD